MLSSAEVSNRLSSFPRFEDMLLSLPYAPRMPKGMVRETREVVAIARAFNEKVARPGPWSSTARPTKILTTCPATS